MLVLYHIQVFHSFNTMFPSVYSFINQMICILQTGGTSSIKVNCVFLYLFTPYISYRHYHNHTYTLHCTWTDYCIGQDIYNYIDDKSQYARIHVWNWLDGGHGFTWVLVLMLFLYLGHLDVGLKTQNKTKNITLKANMISNVTRTPR